MAALRTNMVLLAYHCSIDGPGARLSIGRRPHAVL